MGVGSPDSGDPSDATVYTEATDNTPQPSQGPAGACPECGAPYRHDQRYCLECGAPVAVPPAEGAATIDFAPVPADAGSPPSSPPPHLLGGPAKSADSEPGGSATTIIAAVGVLLLAIGVGVLIGRAGSGGGAPQSGTPQVITVSAPSTSTTSTENTSTKSRSSNSGSHAKHHAKTSGSSNETGASDAHPAPPSVVKKLEEKGGGSYEQKSNNLPNVISTG